MPNPPGYLAEQQQQAPQRNYAALFWRACRRYVETWDSSRMAQQAAQQEGERRERIQAGREEPTLTEEFAAAAKGGGAALKPFLANLYETRARAYKDAVQQFVEGQDCVQ
ncbi:hypothetical protein C2E20_4100 [Micractinium conductrix]|uniref:Uncharacterized protein n=1 Tax=Micractinium conductrix TaxID=554055 RepID=A0A2P6VF92_9CHLO|nr:hypothetical protein C2E20_4100 [Micractinium conductrix]|eukprot:PSC72739.1 hypothetical protein C2E20_4100 [Micractinium conductrix]